jgi:hypothetical protein
LNLEFRIYTALAKNKNKKKEDKMVEMKKEDDEVIPASIMKQLLIMED